MAARNASATNRISAMVRHAAQKPPHGFLYGASFCSATAQAAERKPWRLSASVIVLAPKQSVPSCEYTGKQGENTRSFDYRVCCLRRTARSSFMPDAMVFPGGAVDVADVQSGAELLGAGDGATLRCAAVRETFEESGVNVFSAKFGFSESEHSQWRGRLRKDASELRALCQEQGVKPAASVLHPWCRFITPDMEHNRLKRGGFDTHFFAFCADAEDVQFAKADQQETVQLLWLTPDEALQAVFEGSITMVPPQWFILKELAEFCPTLVSVGQYSSSASRALQRDYPIKPYLVEMSVVEQEAFLTKQGIDPKMNKENVFSLCYPGDESHPVYPGRNGARHRMLMVGTFGGRMKYHLERNGLMELPLQEVAKDWYTLAKL